MSDEKKLDYKSAGIGGVAGSTVIGLLMALQNQGINSINDKTIAERQVLSQAIEFQKTRMDKFEGRFSLMEAKIDRGFDSLRDQNSRLSEIVRLATSDRYTKTEHNSYKDSVELRLQRIEDDLKKKKDK